MSKSFESKSVLVAAAGEGGAEGLAPVAAEFEVALLAAGSWLELAGTLAASSVQPSSSSSSSLLPELLRLSRKEDFRAPERLPLVAMRARLRRTRRTVSCRRRRPVTGFAEDRDALVGDRMEIGNCSTANKATAMQWPADQLARVEVSKSQRPSRDCRRGLQLPTQQILGNAGKELI